MKKMNEQQIDQLLSQYIDGVLSEKEILEVESLLESDFAIRLRMQELKHVRALLMSQQKLTPDTGFWNRFSHVFEEQKNDDLNLLPFPRKFIPALSVISAVVLVVAGAFLMQNRMQFMKYFSEKSQAVREVYEKNVLQGQLLPLFSRVDKDQALQFSLFGTLALDDKSKTELRVDEQSKQGYRIEVGKDTGKKTRPVTFDHFLAEVKPTDQQKHLIDSLLELTGRRIESSVLIGENNTMAIAPDLPKLNRMMVTNIAACLRPNQQVQFERFLEANDAPYSVTAEHVPVRKGMQVFQKIPPSPRDDRFVIITPDTMIYSKLHIDIDSLHQHIRQNMIAFELRREAMIKRMLANEFRRAARNAPLPPPIQSFGNEEFFSVEINIPTDENEQPMHVVIHPRIRKHVLQTAAPNHSLQLQGEQDSVTEGQVPDDGVK
jgi:hypothetical protein